MRRFPRGLMALFFSFSLVACGDDPELHNQQDPADTDTELNQGNSDGSDDGDSGEVDEDTGDDSKETDQSDDPESCQPLPSPSLGTTALANQWRQDASRCGQPSFSVLEDPALGDLVALGTSRTFNGQILNNLAQSEGLTPPKEIKYDSRIRIFSYLTRDRGELIEATALVAHPITDDPDFEPQAPILFLHGTTGFTDQCAPSNMLEVQLLSAVFASMGYAVIAPDFIGMKSMGEPSEELHPYLVGQPTAIASLDSLRAFHKLPPAERGNHCYPHDYVSLGGSQGGHAALWIDRLSTTYAPEFTHLGSVATVPPADLMAQAEKALLAPISATRNAIAFLGTAPFWYGYGDRLDEVFLSPFDEDVPEVFANGCNFRPITNNYSTLDEIFTDTLLDPIAQGELIPDPWACMVEDNGLLTTTTEREGPFVDSYSILFILGEDDDLVDTPIERNSFLALCEEGLPLSYLECAGGPHGATTAWALPEIIAFLDARLSRTPVNAEELCVLSAPTRCENTP